MPKPQVALVNDGGQVVGHKPKNQIGEGDTYHAVFVLLVTRARKVALSNIGGGRFSASAVGICMEGEGAQNAAKRVAPGVALHHLGDQFFSNAAGRKMYISVFYGVIDVKAGERYRLLSAVEVEGKLKVCTPALQFVWAQYKAMLPL